MRTHTHTHLILMWKHNYCKLKKIGRGEYGGVYLARVRTPLPSHSKPERNKALGKCKSPKHKMSEVLPVRDQIVAIKAFNSGKHKSGITASTLREIALLRRLQIASPTMHPCIVTLLDVHFEREKVFGIFEYMHQDLYSLLKSNKTIALPMALAYVYQLLHALRHCHRNGIVHRDVKLENVLITRDGTLKLADFGLSKAYSMPTSKNSTLEIQSLIYRAPEVVLGDMSYTTSVDIWSTGCVLFELVNSISLFDASNEAELITQVVKRLGMPDTSILSLPRAEKLLNTETNRNLLQPPHNDDNDNNNNDEVGKIIQHMIQWHGCDRSNANSLLKEDIFDEVRFYYPHLDKN